MPEIDNSTVLTNGFERIGPVVERAPNSVVGADVDLPFDRQIEAPAKPFEPPHLRRRPERVDPQESARVLERPAWHRIATPAPVAEAFARAQAAGDALDATVAAVQELGADQLAEQRANEAAIVAAVEARKGAPKTKATDWAAEEVARRTKHRVARQALADARRAYDVAVAAALPAWREALAGQIAERRAEARAAFAEAQRAIGAFRSVVEAAGEAHRALNPGERGWHRTTTAAMALVPAGLQGLDAVRRLIDSDDPIVSGAYLVEDDGLVPPRHTRAAMAERRNGWWMLGEIEAAEDYAHTRYTGCEYRGRFDGRISPELAERLRSRDLGA